MTGYRRSRALWDEARRPDASRMAVVRAILYEVQPIRIRSIDTVQLRAYWHTLARTIIQWTTQTLPTNIRHAYTFFSTLSRKSWMIIAGVILYYFAVRIIHDLLDAGPVVMILTALFVIFTVGLGDNNNNNNGGVSAYSVFNRGFERLMGSVDVENLIHQHVGGGMAAAAAMGMANHDNNHHHNPGQGRRNPIGARQPARNMDRQNNNNHVEDDDDYRHYNDDDDDDDDDMPDGQDEDELQQQQQVPPNGVARKSGKKARRRDLEQRRELQRQRRAAMEMGLQDDDIVMQRLMEEQIMAAENR